jgi:hypothetical protein
MGYWRGGVIGLLNNSVSLFTIRVCELNKEGSFKELPLETNTNFFASFLGRQDRQRRRALGQRALTGCKIVAIAVIGATDRCAAQKLTGNLEIGFFVWTMSGKSKIFPLDERQEHLAPAEVDFLHAAGRQFADTRHRNKGHSHALGGRFLLTIERTANDLAR